MKNVFDIKEKIFTKQFDEQRESRTEMKEALVTSLGTFSHYFGQLCDFENEKEFLECFDTLRKMVNDDGLLKILYGDGDD